jgi:hypothetical protein
LYSSIDSTGNTIAGFSYKTTRYEVLSPSASGETIVWLKLVRVHHVLTGYCSADGHHWIPVGSSINVSDMENLQPNYNAWTGNRQGLFVQGNSADFDFYVYRDAYTPILAECPANQYGTTVSVQRNGMSCLQNMQDNGWALYAGVEFGNAQYLRSPDSLELIASCASSGCVVEVWRDSLDSGTKIAECTVGNTGSWTAYQAFRTNVVPPVSGVHDVYLRFRGTGTSSLILLQWLTFLDESGQATPVDEPQYGGLPETFELQQNYPNPFNPSTTIGYSLPATGNGHESMGTRWVRLVVYDMLGREVMVLVDEKKEPGEYHVKFDAAGLASGVYLYRLTAGGFVQTKTMALVK